VYGSLYKEVEVDMTWLITGGSGQLGLALQRELNAKNIDFVAPSSNDLDITNFTQISNLFKNINPRIVVNAAAWTDVETAETEGFAAFKVNALGARNLAASSKRVGSTFLHISTDYVFSGTRSTPWQESSEVNPISVYGVTKSEGEILVKMEYPEKSFIIRTAWLYSESSDNFARKIARLAMKDSGIVTVVNDQIGQPTYAGDLALKIIDLINTDAPIRLYHGTNSGEASWFDFAVEIFRYCGADIKRIIPITSNEFKSKVQRPKYSVLGHSNWEGTKCGEMRDWKIALGCAMPEILRSVKE